jgi:hypothetical protein
MNIYFSELSLWVQRVPEFENESTEWFEAQYEDLSFSADESQHHRWLVSALRSYTKYHFKVVFTLSADFQGFETQPSLTVRTLPGGSSSAPIIHGVQQVSLKFPRIKIRQ